MQLKADKMATKLNNLNLIPRTCMVEREDQLLRTLPYDLHTGGTCVTMAQVSMCAYTHMHVCMQAHTH